MYLMTSVWIVYCVTVNFLVSTKFGKMALDQLVLAKLKFSNLNACIAPEVHMHKLVTFTQFAIFPCYIYSKYVCISRLN